MTPRTVIRCSLAALWLIPLAACVTAQRLDCDRPALKAKPVTTYELAKTRSGQPPLRVLPSGSLPQAPTYTMKFVPGFTKACGIIALRKDVVILRSRDRNLVFNETREFYADDGTLIATTTQNISDQVGQSGQYLATTPLPIPKNAPPGKYRIVSTLNVERRGQRRSHQIARAEGNFYIIPNQ